MIQALAQGLLYIYVLGMIPFLFFALRGLQSVQNKTDSRAVRTTGSVIAVIAVLITWPILFVRGFRTYLKNRNRAMSRRNR